MTPGIRGELSLGDLLVAAHRLGARRPGDLTAFLAGDHPAMPPVGPGDAVPSGPDSSAAAPGPAADPPARTPTGPAPGTRDTGSPSAAGPGRAPAVTTVASDTELPGWWASARSLPVPRPRRIRLIPEPPITPLRARSAIMDITRSRRPGQDVDIAALLDRAARGRSMTPLPLRPTWRTAPAVEVLVDAGEGMEPYRADVRFLMRMVEAVTGRAGTRIRTFTGDPGRGVNPDHATRLPGPWPLPAPGVLVVVLSDLGMGGPALSPDRSAASAWLTVAHRIRDTGNEVVVLTPFPPERVPPTLRRAMPIIGWDELDRAGGVRLRDGRRHDQ